MLTNREIAARRGTLTGYYRIPASWQGSLPNGHKISATGCATYRAVVTFPEVDENQQCKIVFSGVRSSCKVYVNGQLAGNSGVVGDNAGKTVGEMRKLVAAFCPLPGTTILLFRL